MNDAALKTETYTRENPSERYKELIALYQNMHENGTDEVPAEKMFAGISLPPQAAAIRPLIEKRSVKTVLDYGCGKGQQYGPMELKHNETGQTWPDIKSFWGVDSITCYDPAYKPHSEVPTGTYDAVICTDVLEHCPEEDVPWILGELFAYANKLIFANIACYPAKKTLPNGENAHCTIQPPQWWANHIEALANRYPDVAFEFVVAFFEDTPQGPQGKQVALKSKHFNS